MSQRVPISLYIHIPWCIKKCPYCDFNSHVSRQEIPEKSYLQAIITDFCDQLSYLEMRQINTIFIGGGTPSLMSHEFYQALLEKISPYLVKNAEITLEANPGSIDFTEAFTQSSKFHAYRQLGINRLSLGIQSLQNDKLQALGRVHLQDEALQAITLAKHAGFTNFNCDLMFGLPNQTIADALADLSGIIEHNPTHISWYQLTIEPNTHFYRKPPKLPEDDYILDMQQQGQALLAKHGYHQYEVSAYAKEKYQCQHNRNYWLFGDYLGIGAGAHGKITNTHTGKIIRTENHKHPKMYLETERKQAQLIHVLKEQVIFEFLLNTLRLQEPITFDLFEQRCNLPKTLLQQQLTKGVADGLIEVFDDAFRVTDKGRWFVDEVLVNCLTS